MKTTNKLYLSKSKNYNKDGVQYRIKFELSLDDDCKNKVYEFSLTGQIEEQRKNGRWVDFAGGCIHEEILKHFPELEPFAKLHLCNYLGQPMYSIENGFYWLEKDYTKMCALFRITEQEGKKFKLCSDKEYFKYKLFESGLVEEWKKEADEAISLLEKWTDTKWSNPYSPEEEKFRLKPLTEEEINVISQRIKSGYYTPEQVMKRKEEEQRTKIEKRIKSLKADAQKGISAINAELEIKLYMVEWFGLKDNFIYYNHSNTIKFNWLKGVDEFTQEEIIDFINNHDKSRLPDGIEFSIAN